MGPVTAAAPKAQRGTPALAPQPAAVSAGPDANGAPASPAAAATHKPPGRSILGLLPSGARRNPFANLQFKPLQCTDMQVAKAFKAHSMGIAHIVLHPRKPIAVRDTTTSPVSQL